MDPDHLGAHVRAGRGLASEGLGGAPDLEAAHNPRGDRGDVVDHESHLVVGGDVAEFAGLAEVQAADVYHACSLVDREADRVVLERAITRERREPPEPLGTQVPELTVAEHQRPFLPVSFARLRCYPCGAAGPLEGLEMAAQITTVDEYIASCPDEVQEIPREIRAKPPGAVPDAGETIS